MEASQADTENSLRITLRIMDPDVSPAEITKSLGLEPDSAYAQGEALRLPRGGTGKVFDGTYWRRRLRTLTGEAARSPGQVLEELAIELARHAPVFARVRAAGGRVEIFLGWMIASNSGMILSAELMARFGAIGLDIDLDLYPIGEDEGRD